MTPRLGTGKSLTFFTVCRERVKGGGLPPINSSCFLLRGQTTTTFPKIFIEILYIFSTPPTPQLTAPADQIQNRFGSPAQKAAATTAAAVSYKTADVAAASSCSAAVGFPTAKAYTTVGSPSAFSSAGTATPLSTRSRLRSSFRRLFGEYNGLNNDKDTKP